MAYFEGQGQGRAHFDCECLANGNKIGLTLLFSSNTKPRIAFRLAFLDLALSRSNGEGQGRAHFDCELVTDGVNIIRTLEYDVACGLSIS